MVHPPLSMEGGISHYVQRLQGKFSANVVHSPAGRRPSERHGIKTPFRLVSDYRRFRRVLCDRRVDLVHLNPSMEPKMVLRESVYLWMAKKHNAKTIVSWHGWSEDLERRFDAGLSGWFQKAYSNADAFVVFCDRFRQKLRHWGFQQPIHREVTVVCDSDLESFDVDSQLAMRMQSPRWRILFLARLVKEKGLFTTIEAFARLREKHSAIDLVIAGKGADEQAAKELVTGKGIEGVSFVGYRVGEDRAKLLRDCHVLCLPTEFAEGLPNTLVEAMAFGLPVITRPVAGICDIFSKVDAGFMVSSRSAVEFADRMEQLYLDKPAWEATSLRNARFGKENFLASSAAKRFDSMYVRLVKGNQA